MIEQNRRFASAGERQGVESAQYAHMVRPRLPLTAGVVAARAAGGLSRFARRGGGTTVPGKVLNYLDPDAVKELAARLPLGSALVSATNGKTTTAAMVAEILRGRARLAHNSSGANLLSGVASTLLSARDAELGLFEVDEAALPEVARQVRPRAVALGNLFRDQLDRYGELELVAQRWRRAVDELGDETALIVNGDDPQVGDLGRGRERTVVFGLDDPRHATAELQHAADSKWCLRCGTPYDYAAAYVGHLGDYRCPACGHARPPLDLVARSIELHGLDAVSFDLVDARGATPVRLGLPGLYNVYNALGAAALARELGASSDDVHRGLERFTAAFGRFERLQMDGRTVLMLLVKNPAGANEVMRTLVAGGAPTLAVIALNDGIADGRDVSWIWDVDFEPLLARLERVVASGDRAAELALRCKYAGFDERSIEVIPSLEQALDRGLELTPAGGELFVIPTYTAMLGLRHIVSDRGYTRPYWERAA
jgi:UDP-N-acetylmuramyl tripeptide synthase